MRILVVNCNVSASMTELIDESAQSAAAPGTVVTTVAPEWGVESAEGYLDSYISAVAVLQRLRTWSEPFDAAVLAGFGEHGREAARELLDVPVVDITDAAAQLALLLAPRYGVVTSLPRTTVQIADSLRNAGIYDHCVGVRATGLPVLDLSDSPEDTYAAVLAESLALLDQGAEAIALGCAGLTGQAEVLSEKLGAPIIDPVRAGVGVAETLVRLGLRTSKFRTFAAPLEKSRPGWDSAVAR
ncbi:MAG: Asp/Glu/hydantoin racemase [Actinobacteria bacterium]|nr:Asp/Glu/hydantoin racemase [Actinomycetota bacterium]